MTSETNRPDPLLPPSAPTFNQQAKPEDKTEPAFPAVAPVQQPAAAQPSTWAAPASAATAAT
ncbi:MAG TPA: hypothetical protein VIH37_08930, partial [Candidatus Limnocylindrales bacterium]